MLWHAVLAHALLDAWPWGSKWLVVSVIFYLGDLAKLPMFDGERPSVELGWGGLLIFAAGP